MTVGEAASTANHDGREIVAQFDDNSGKNRRAFGRAQPTNAEGAARPSFIKGETHELGKEPPGSSV
jgi:hypothetical protein